MWKFCVVCFKGFDAHRGSKCCSKACSKIRKREKDRLTNPFARKRYRLKNIERCREDSRRRSREERKRNPDKVRIRNRKYIKDNPDKKREFDRRYRKKYPEKRLESQRRHRKKYPEKWRERSQRCRNKKAVSEAKMRLLQWRLLQQKPNQNGVCREKRSDQVE